MAYPMGVLGILFVLATAYMLSRDRSKIRLRTVGWGLGMQVILAFLVLLTPFGQVFKTLGSGFNSFLELAEEGSIFLFGSLGDADKGVIFAFQVLPLIILVSALSAILYHLGILQRVVKIFAVIMQRGLRASGAESLNVAANLFLGQAEAPLTIRPYLERLTRSELMTVMTGGMATISGALLFAYVQIGGASPESLISAVVMTAPACIMMSKIFEPEVDQPATLGQIPEQSVSKDQNVIDAAARGSIEGLTVALHVGAMLITFVGLIAVVNGIMAALQGAIGWSWFPSSIQDIMGPIFAPIAWFMGIPWQDAPTIGNLLGTRLILNEFISYSQLSEVQQTLQPQSFVIATYALCGFANFGSIGIQIGALGAYLPDRRMELASIGVRAMIAATLSNFMTASMAGLMLSIPSLRG